MILELVNNVVTDRERELKQKNLMLRAKIEQLEQTMTNEAVEREMALQNAIMQMKQPKKKSKLKPGELFEDDSSEDMDDSEKDDDSSEDADDSDGKKNSSSSDSDEDPSIIA